MTKENLDKANKLSSAINLAKQQLTQLVEYINSDHGLHSVEFTKRTGGLGNNPSFYLLDEDMIKAISKETVKLLENKIGVLTAKFEVL